MEWFIFWVVMAIIAAMIASSKGASAFLFFLYGLVIWPIAIVHALLLKSPASSQVDRPSAFAATAPAPAREVIGVVSGTPYWSEPGGKFGARIGGDIVIFPSIAMLEAAVGGGSHQQEPPKPKAPPQELKVSEPRMAANGKIEVEVNGVTHYFSSVAEAQEWINRARRYL